MWVCQQFVDELVAQFKSNRPEQLLELTVWLDQGVFLSTVSTPSPHLVALLEFHSCSEMTTQSSVPSIPVHPHSLFMPPS